MDQIAERERLRRTFDAVAGDYQDARPEYPDSLYSALLALTGVRPEADALCEVGCASGKATLPLARRGFAITCVELGAALAAEARRNLAAFARVTVVNADFEAWPPPAGETFGLVFAATAWHWIDPAVKYRKAASLLRPGGHLAFWEAVHVIPDDGDPFFTRDPGRVRRDRRGPAGRLGVAHGGDAAVDHGRDHGQRIVRRGDHPAVRLGDPVRRRLLHPAARHFLRAH